MLNTLTLNEIITELRQELTKLYGDQLKKLILYGSQARGDANEDSDIDLMIVLTHLTSPGDEIFRMGKIKNQLDLKYDQLISIFSISEKDFSDKKTPLLENIRREGISLWDETILITPRQAEIILEHLKCFIDETNNWLTKAGIL